MIEIKDQPTVASLGVRFDAVEQLVKQNESLFQSVEKSIARIGWFLTVAVAVFGLGATANGYIQYDRVSKEIESAETRVNDLIASAKPQDILSTSVLNTIDDTDVIYGEPYLSYKQYSDTGIYVYYMTFDFHARASFNGKGLNHFNGVELKYSQKYVNEVLKNNLHDVSTEALLTGLTSTFDTPNSVTPNTYYPFSFNTVSLEKNCPDVEKHIKEVLSAPDLGSVEITPVYDISSSTPATKKMRIVAKDMYRTFNCADIEAGIKKASAQNPVAPPAGASTNP